jgi:hypothetical protein
VADVAASQEQHDRFCEALRNESTCDLPIGRPRNYVDLLEGDEDIGMAPYRGASHGSLMALLSLSGAKSLPFGNAVGPEDKPILPFWHQLAGICTVLAHSFTHSIGVPGTPTMLCDEVGLGKTTQILGVIQMIAHMHHQQEMSVDKKLQPLNLAISEWLLTM